MQITADVNKFSKSVQRDLTFILNVLSESSLILPSFQKFLLIRMLLASHKMVTMVTMLERARTFAATI